VSLEAFPVKVYRFFDWAALVDKFGGDEEFVRSLLGVTLRASSSLPMELRNACAAADFATLAGLAHKVKGTAGDIVATALQFQARDAELAARATEADAIGMNLQLADTLDEFLGEIRSAVGRPDSTREAR
jgi:HPt (histidine-containing phosphotransfer) domain-containing protein